jgi:hypothetical protein
MDREEEPVAYRTQERSVEECRSKEKRGGSFLYNIMKWKEGKY